MRTPGKLTLAAGVGLLGLLTWVLATSKPPVAIVFRGYQTNTIVIAPAPVSIKSNIVWARFQLTNGGPRALRYSNFRCAMETSEGWYDVARPGRATSSANTLQPSEALDVWLIVPRQGRPLRATVDFSARGQSSRLWDRLPRWLHWAGTNHSVSITLPNR
jgi:hypothetical protein